MSIKKIKSSSNLANQFYIYSVDTSAFYSDEEHNIQQKIYDLQSAEVSNKKDIEQLKKELKQKISEYKRKRSLREQHLREQNIISLFESTLSRTLKIETNSVNKDLIVVQTYYHQILEDLIKYGFQHDNENYILFTASAGQIRQKKAVFIKEVVWEAHKNTLMCGLTIDRMNEQGGMNVNKLLAYLALSNSATQEWSGFDINKCIVVNDMESNVNGIVDYIDNKTYAIERMVMGVPVNHTDGCGMVLPSVSKKSFMVRLPWIKGLMVPFDFRNKRWILEGTNSVKVVDIYGKEWDLIKDDIQIIFTKSQFKMHSYYADWQSYKDNFITYGCQASKCNEEESIMKDSKLNYQMLQTLTDISDEELKQIASSTNEIIRLIGQDKDTMLKVLGVKKNEKDLNSFQKALSIYPELLTDNYSKEIIKQTKKSIVKEAKAGKLRIKGKYTYIICDLYAFCEWLFLGIEKPKGLLHDGEVYCSLYENNQKLDVLRSPHLYKEHCIRVNAIDAEKAKWFISKGIYTSTHDLISKVLQFDVDGDKSLVVADPTIISVAERNMEGIVPLYYEMSVAKKERINKDSIYKSLIAAYKANIGEVSNKITKIFNSGNEINLNIVKWLCFENNEIIDYAKTLHKSEKPEHVKVEIANAVKSKSPHFFIYAKDQDIHNVEPMNNSVVNRLNTIVMDKRISFREMKGKCDYRMLMKNCKLKLDEKSTPIIELYDSLNRSKKWIMNKVRNHQKNVKYEYVWKYIRDELLKVNNDVEYVSDTLVKLLFEERKSYAKETLWKCFGDVMLNNLERNVHGTMQCEDCGKRIKRNNNKQRCCEKCADLRSKENKKKWKEKNRKTVAASNINGF